MGWGVWVKLGATRGDTIAVGRQSEDGKVGDGGILDLKNQGAICPLVRGAS